MYDKNEEEHSSSGFCIKSVRLKSSQQVTVPENLDHNFSFWESIESVFPLVDIIFSFLCDEDLKRISEVKLSWKEVADRILGKRSKVGWISCYKKNKSNVLNFSDDLHFSNARNGVLLYDHRRLKLNKFICLHTSTGSLKRMTFAEYLSEDVVGTNVNYCLLSCPKVVSNFGFPKQEQAPDGHIFDGVFLPEIPDIRTVLFYCNLTKLKKDKTLLEKYINSNEQVKCILMFPVGNVHNSAIENFLDILLDGSEPEDLALGGGIIQGTKTFQNSQPLISTRDVFCITFLQQKEISANFGTFSCVISGNDLSDEEFTEKLSEFKNRIELRTHSVAFRICCSAKWDKDEENLIFQTVFPGNIPILGLEANGEIGWNSPKISYEDKTSKKPKKARKYPKMDHQWSTVFVLITWGDIKN